jgi:hypothetical protein
MSTLSLSRSKQLLESDGWKVAIVEKWNQWAHIRQDLFGMCDLIAIRPDRSGVTGIQACGEDVSIHVHKLLEGYWNIKGKFVGPNDCLPIWLKAGNPFFIWAWRKRGAEGKRKTWELRQVEFVLKDSQVIAQEIPDTKELQANGD